MISQPPVLLRRAIKRVHCALLVAGLCGLAAALGAETTREAASQADAGAIPEPLKDDAFDELLTSSPFTRTLGASDSLIFTGVARFGDDVFATLLDTKTLASQVVSHTPNSEGWQLISVEGDPAKLHTWTAKIQIRGGEVISIRYQKPPPKLARTASGAGGGSGGGPGGSSPPLSASQVEEAKKAAVNYREGFASDGYPRQPPPEMVAKLSRLSVGQREDINRQMIGHRNRGLGLDESRRIYEDIVNKATQSRR